MKPLRLAIGSAAVALVALGAWPPVLGQEGVLRYRWTKGEALRYRVVQQMNTAMTGIPGMGEMNVQSTITQVVQLTTENVAADGTGTIQTKFESVKMEMGTPMGTFVYDSAAPAQNTADPMVAQIAATMGALVGETITMVLSPNGSIQKIDGMTRIAKKVQQTMPQGMGGFMGGGIDSILSDDGMMGTFGQSFAQFPGTPVKTGETWKSDVKVPNPFGTMTISNTSTLKAFETVGGNDLARIVIASTIKSVPSEKPPALPMPMTLQMSDGTGDGETVFDRKLGRVVRGTANTTLPMSMNMTAPDGTAISMQALTKTTMTMELIEK